jgi:hypothetical protein
MTRFIVIALLLVVLGLSVQNLMQRLRSLGSGDTRRSVPPASRPKPRVEETLIRCTACGTHFSSSRALKRAGGGADVFCSEECLQISSTTPSA